MLQLRWRCWGRLYPKNQPQGRESQACPVLPEMQRYTQENKRQTGDEDMTRKEIKTRGNLCRNLEVGEKYQTLWDKVHSLFCRHGTVIYDLEHKESQCLNCGKFWRR